MFDNFYYGYVPDLPDFRDHKVEEKFGLELSPQLQKNLI